ncbi:type II secretion system F family protein [Rubellimicrobium arenae]|uniref:type II secretion system F family protein n=1 Tax=Rubellimicrobium arenae TaxID=2817372 RepID=UPI001B309D6C|nr:type II secretion system F family protein [Rubellimicrobium arenae]
MHALALITTWLQASLGPSGPMLLLGALGLLMILVALPVLLVRPRDAFDRLTTPKSQDTTEAGGDTLRRPDSADKLERFSTFLEPRSASEYSAIRLKLLQAGYGSKDAVRLYYFLQVVLGLGSVGLGTTYTIYLSAGDGPPATSSQLVLRLLLPGIIGYLLPKYWVTRRQAERKEAVTNAFPDSLDMMLVCVEAGQSLDQAILRVAQELGAGAPDLAREFELVSHELKAGKDKSDVLRDMAERCGVLDISSFVTVLIQSQQFGTTIADALRVHASEMRDKRVMRAEEKANTLPTKMTLATMLLTVPPLLIILIGPALFEISDVLGSSRDATVAAP